MSTLLPCVEIEPRQPATASVIWLHGLGANGHDFEPVVPELRLPDTLPVRFVFPHAPSIPVTINGGMVMPAWYDILAIDIDRTVDDSQIRQSAEAIRQLIARENQRGIPASRIVLAGFSQGGAVAYETALTHPEPLAGLIALSTYFATQASLQPNPANRDIPILVCHGTHDPMVQESLGRQAVALLQERGYQPDYKTYPMPHAVCAEEIRDISQWLQQRLA